MNLTEVEITVISRAFGGKRPETDVMNAGVPVAGVPVTGVCNDQILIPLLPPQLWVILEADPRLVLFIYCALGMSLQNKRMFLNESIEAFPAHDALCAEEHRRSFPFFF